MNNKSGSERLTIASANSPDFTNAAAQLIPSCMRGEVARGSASRRFENPCSVVPAPGRLELLVTSCLMIQAPCEALMAFFSLAAANVTAHLWAFHDGLAHVKDF